MKKVFVCFDHVNDARYKYLLEAWPPHPRFRFLFANTIPAEVASSDIAKVKKAITTQINDATHSLVIIGKTANKPHQLAKLIGYQNWLNFEIAHSKAHHNRLVAVKLDRSYEMPTELFGANASWIIAFDYDLVIRALIAL